MEESKLFVIVKKMHANTRICFNNADIGVHSFGFSPEKRIREKLFPPIS